MEIIVYNEIQMPAKISHISCAASEKLQDLGRSIRVQRQSMKISATTTAEAAHISRVTLNRIEKGEPSVTMGAYFLVMDALGMQIQALAREDSSTLRADLTKTTHLPDEIKFADYPQLKQLAWHVHGLDSLTPIEAFGIYDRNWRHLDQDSLLPNEMELINALKQADASGKI